MNAGRPSQRESDLGGTGVHAAIHLMRHLTNSIAAAAGLPQAADCRLVVWEGQLLCQYTRLGKHADFKGDRKCRSEKRC